MSRANWQKVKKIFNDALEIPADGRDSFLNEACAGDESVRRDVEVLLRSFEDDFLERPAIGQVAEAIVEERFSFRAGERIGDYRIVRPLGAGGQGAVFLAEDLRLKRPVALKFLPPEASAASPVGRRFRREAQAAAALSHPNICAIHKIDADEGREFIVMQYAEGETLAGRLKKEKPALRTAIAIAVQIADALREAHAHGVIHRDIKPSNIVVSDDDQVSVLDFGLAKISEEEEAATTGRKEKKEKIERAFSAKTTLSGVVMGTVSYMSPEQARGAQVDFRTDIWSLGVVLYEMATGENPFFRDNLAESFAAIIAFEPDLDALPPPLRGIVGRALRKNADERYGSADEALAELRARQSELSFEERLRNRDPGFEKPAAKKPRSGWKRIVVAALGLTLLTAGGLYYRHARNRDWARENVKRVAELAKADRTFEAHDLAREIQKYLPDDEQLARSTPLFTDRLSVKTEPPGAKVYLKRFQPDAGGKFPGREFVGETPLENKPIARGQYLVTIEKEGFAAFARSVSGRLPDYSTDLIGAPPLEISVKMLAADALPDRMVFVPGGEYRLVSYTRPTAQPIALGDFLIDKYEVSNAEFKEFVTAGGYSKKEFWPASRLRDGREIPFEEAVKNFRDRTGLPGPRAWTNQEYPEGKADFPVTDITWYEAAAYARFRGKELPTVFQWEKAARDGNFDQAFNTMPWGLSRDADAFELLANFRGAETVAVASFEFGMSPYGAFNMAGNAAEWLLNRRGENALVSGGAFGEKSYLFGYYGDFPPVYSSDKIGFRLVKNLSETENGAGDLPPVEVPVYKASGAADFKKWLVHYAYDKTPLAAEVVERAETEAWTREKIAFTGASREPTLAYLYLPKNAPRPLQVVHWVPAADVPLGFSSLPHSVEDMLAPVIKRGRAVFAVVLKGYHERPRAGGYESPAGTSVEFRKEMVERVTDWRRGLDYLETRGELRPGKIAFLGLSNGANLGLILTAVETRYASVALVGGGVRQPWSKWIAEANFVNFAPHIGAPKLVLKGRYDEAHPLKTEAEPLFHLLREPRRIVIVESGHVPPPEIFAPAVNEWLDETLGKAFD